MADVQLHEDWQQWLKIAKTTKIDHALRDLFARVGEAIDAGPPEGDGPVCNTSGRCCKFEAFGHRLYVTGLEIAWFVLNLPSDAPEAEGIDEGLALPQLAIPVVGSEAPVPVPGACVHQIEGLCSTHAIRPLGCRVFFCDEASESWQHALYEKYQAELRQLHDKLQLPYAYMEWRAGLAVGKQQAGLSN